MHQISYLFYNSNLVQKINLKNEENKYEDSIFLCVKCPRYTLFTFSLMKIRIMYPYKASFESKIQVSSFTYLTTENRLKINFLVNIIFCLYIAKLKKLYFNLKKERIDTQYFNNIKKNNAIKTKVCILKDYIHCYV